MFTNRGLERILRKEAKVRINPSSERFSAARDSFMKHEAMSNRTPIASNAVKMPRQPTLSVIIPPATGATTGAIPLIAPIIAIIFASFSPQ